MADLFISYKREDLAVARQIKDSLEQLGFQIWWDVDLMAGDRFRAVIHAAIDECKAVAVLWSTGSIRSDFVLDEATYAKDHGKLFPVRIDKVTPPLGFGQVQTTDLNGWRGDPNDAVFKALVLALQQRVGRQARLATMDAQAAQPSPQESSAATQAEPLGDRPGRDTPRAQSFDLEEFQELVAYAYEVNGLNMNRQNAILWAKEMLREGAGSRS